jgi:hypothetical protein
VEGFGVSIFLTNNRGVVEERTNGTNNCAQAPASPSSKSHETTLPVITQCAVWQPPHTMSE